MGVEEDWELEGEEAVEAVAVAAVVVEVVGGLARGLGLVGLEDPAAEAAADVAVAVVVLLVGFLGLKPGKALPWTSWPERTMGGSLAQYCAVGSGGGREFSPIRGCVRRGREQLLQISRPEVVVVISGPDLAAGACSLEVITSSVGTPFKIW